MSNTALEQFWTKVENDNALKQELEALFQPAGDQPSTKAEAIVDLARRSGFEFTNDDLKNHLAAKQGELSGSDLATVAGGMKYTDLAYKYQPLTSYKISFGMVLF